MIFTQFHLRKTGFQLISVIFLLLFTSQLASALHYGHLRDEEVNFMLAYLGSSKEAVLDAYFKKWDIPPATAEILLKICLAPESAESKAWAEEVLKEEDSRFYAEVAVAYHILNKRKDPKPIHHYYFELNTIDPQYSYFSGNLGVILDATYPRVIIDGPEYSLIKGAFQGDLTKDEEEALQSLAYSNLAAQITAPATKFRELFPSYPYDAYAYIHYTGDRFFLEQLWESPLRWQHRTTVLNIARIAKDSRLTLKVLKWLDETEWPEEKPLQGEYNMMAGLSRGIFMAHKDLDAVGKLIRKWAQEPDAQFFQRDQLFMIMSQPGWSKDEDMFNKGVIIDYYVNNMRIMNAAETALKAMDKREEARQEK